MQESFHEKVANAAEKIASLMPSYISSFSKEEKDGYIEVVLGNPSQEEKPIWISTAGEEITFVFAESHFHISDYSEETKAEELIEEMISAIVRIVTGVDLTYSAWLNDSSLGGGFIESKPQLNEIGTAFKKANKFKICGWEIESNQVINI
ncbi:MAG: hypothetical protein H6975_01475 [Gammaproteobacteria bacterium]|nr:hypothetical protein [Gammaproteobacteria bacterium]